MIRQRFSTLLPHFIAFIIMIGVNVVYFLPQFQGKVMTRHDAVQSYNMRGEFHEFEEQNGLHQPYYWNNSMFGGMPDKLLTLGRSNNILGQLVPVSRLFIDSPIGVFFASMLICYLSLVLLGISPWMSLLGAIFFGFNTNHFILWETGHALKNYTISFFPAIVAGLILVTRMKYLSGGLLFSIGVSLSVYSNHPQMFYYLMLSLGVFFLVYLVVSLITQTVEIKDLAKMCGVLSVGLLLGLLSNISQLQSTLSFSQVTMRGEPLLTNNRDADPSSKVKGLDWEYSMRWSNGPKDVLSTMIPRASGGSGAEEMSADSHTGKLLKSSGQRPKADGKFLVPLYHGGLPFTSGPLYLGAIVLFLFFCAVILLPRNYGIGFGVMAVIIAIVSMGSNMSGFNRFLFEYLPYYNKFRAPTSIYHGVGILFVIPGILILKKVISKKIAWKQLLLPAALTAGTCLFLALLGSTIIDFSHAADARYGPDVVKYFKMDRMAAFRGDSFRSFFLITLVLAAIIAYLNQKVVKTSNSILLIIGLLGLIDLWGIGRRYLDQDDWVSERVYNENFAPRKVDLEIKKLEPKGRGYYRVHDLSINTFNSASTSYHHNTVGGYSATKMQRIEDIIDRYIQKGNMNVLNMLNTKYIITSEGQLQVNERALGNAWFVSDLKKVNSSDEEIQSIEQLDLSKNAVVLEKEFNDALNQVKVGDGIGNIELTEYAPGYLKYNSRSASDQVAVFSEIWYPEFWDVTIDGKPTDMFRVNYILRAVGVPQGNHEIVFSFRPQPKLGWLSLISSVLLALALIYLVYKRYKKEEVTKA